MKTVCTIEDIRNLVRSWRREGLTVGFVPTMGALHQGHASLMEQARRSCDRVVVSIFVNPLQFGPEEDFAVYPRTLESDAALCQAAGVDALFTPSACDLTPPTMVTSVNVGSLAQHLCGPFRPGHFQGVATIVTKLFTAVEPDRVYFGEKDYQQLQVVKALVRDLNLAVVVIPGATVREVDGLALSSRNRRLTPSDRQSALAIPRSLLGWQERCQRSTHRAADIETDVRAALTENSRGNPLRIEYVQVVHPETLQPVLEAGPDSSAVLAVAAKVGTVRLIDNVRLGS